MQPRAFLSAERLSISPSNPAEVQPTRGSRKEFFTVIGLIAIIIVALVTLVFLAVPSFFGQNGSSKLGLNYAVGEEMTYNITATSSYMGETQTRMGTMTQKILGVTGKVYTIFATNNVPPAEFESFTFKMDNTGRLIDVEYMPDSMQSMYDSFNFLPGYGMVFPEEEAEVGISWQIPLNTALSGYVIEGTVTYNVTEMKTLTVPADTYNVFKVEYSTGNINITSNSSQTTTPVYMNIYGYVFLEKGTGRTVELMMTESLTNPALTGTNATIRITMQIQLTQHKR